MTDLQPPAPPSPDAAWQPPAVPPSGRSKWANRRVVVPAIAAVAAVIVLAVVLLLTVGGSGDFTVRGGVEVKGTDSFVATGQGDNACAGSGGYDDLATGAQVVVTDNTARTIAVGTVTGSAAKGDFCLLTFDVPSVPEGKKFYGLEVSHRGVVQFTEQEMKAGPMLTIGSDG